MRNNEIKLVKIEILIGEILNKIIKTMIRTYEIKKIL